MDYRISQNQFVISDHGNIFFVNFIFIYKK
uniref:Uncharacterized protein n=1 Tax=viral metagenome TaxID=1070528 RepID=A0A6C0JRR4_9ZZZZ